MKSDTTQCHRRLPAEWEESDAVMIAWPHVGTDWEPILDEVTRTYIDIARAVIKVATLVVIAPDVSLPKRYLATYDSEERPIVYCQIPTNDTWARDFGPITVEESYGHGGDAAMVPLDFTFNGWGMKFAADRDNLITSRMAEKALFASQPEGHREFVLEGGSIESDGRGTLMTTSECLLSPNRNPWMDKAQIEEYLLRTFGARHMLWVDHGYLAGDDTDSHIDTLARLAPDNIIIYVTPPDDEADEHYDALKSMERQLTRLRTPEGEPYHLIGLPMADARYDEDGNRLPATYANYLVVNGTILMPSYGSPQKDELAAKMLGIAYPGYNVVQIDCTPLIRQHGSLHCVTMQLPKGTLSAGGVTAN